MLCIAFQWVALLASLVQSAATMPLRTGEVARQLMEDDIAGLEMVLPPGEKPWLLNGDGAQYGNGQFIQAFLPPTLSTPALRRGSSRAHATPRITSAASSRRSFDPVGRRRPIMRPFTLLTPPHSIANFFAARYHWQS